MNSASPAPGHSTQQTKRAAQSRRTSSFRRTRLPSGQWYRRIDAVHELADGRLVATERDCHPDSIAEAFRRRITVLELQQIIGRGRGLWRTADNPLHVLVLTDVPLDMPVEELTTDAAERPSFEDRQIAVGAIAFECAAHRRSNLLTRSSPRHQPWVV